jgi:hypothetical protein
LFTLRDLFHLADVCGERLRRERFHNFNHMRITALEAR